MKLYKILDYNNGYYKTLFHGVNRSKTLPLYTWLEAEIKYARDGSGDKWYNTGFHCISSILDCYVYLNNFKDINNKAILPCYAEGIWEKSRKDGIIVYLARRIYLFEE